MQEIWRSLSHLAQLAAQVCAQVYPPARMCLRSGAGTLPHGKELESMGTGDKLVDPWARSKLAEMFYAFQYERFS